MKKSLFIFGGLCAIILLLFQLERWSLFALGVEREYFIVLSGFIFLLLGILMSRFFILEKKKFRQQKLHSRLSHQELKVLQLMAEGLSNREIAAQLFIAESTVKSHVSNILSKLAAKRRTEAVKIGREIGAL